MEKHHYTTISQQLKFVPSAVSLVSHLLLDLLLVAAIVLLLRSPFWVCANLLLPILLFRSFALMHDCVHGSATPFRTLNDVIGVFAGGFCFLPYEPWKKIHLEHHKWTGNVDRDPSMGLIKQFPKFSDSKVQILNFCWKYWIPAMATSQHLVFWTKSYQYVLNANSSSASLKNLVSIAFPALLYFYVPWPAIFPGILAYLLMVEVINFPHHLQMPMIRGNESFPVYQQDQLARSCIYPKWFSRHILNNFNLHIEHHLFPRLPWYRLEEAHFMIRQLDPKNYAKIRGNHWIRENRQKPVASVFAPNFTHESEKSTQREAA